MQRIRIYEGLRIAICKKRLFLLPGTPNRILGSDSARSDRSPTARVSNIVVASGIEQMHLCQPRCGYSSLPRQGEGCSKWWYFEVAYIYTVACILDRPRSRLKTNPNPSSAITCPHRTNRTTPPPAHSPHTLTCALARSLPQVALLIASGVASAQLDPVC